MVTSLIGKDAEKATTIPSGSGAGSLGWQDRIQLSVEVLARKQPVGSLAQRCGVSRNFLYRQAGKAQQALTDAFSGPAEPAEKVLYQVPITQDWIRQFVLALALLGHSSYRGIIQIAEDLLDYRGLSVGTVHAILSQAADRARKLSVHEDLSAVRVGAHDEIYQAGRPVLVGADIQSTYCYLLAEAEHCDETTWGVHLLDLAGRGLHPQFTVADGGPALRAGQRTAWGSVPCHADVFHAERELTTLAGILSRRAAGCAATVADLQHRWDKVNSACRYDRSLSYRLGAARREWAKTHQLAQDLRLLSDWLRQDILALSGPNLACRRELFDFVAQELRQREPLCPRRIGPVLRLLQRQRDDLLAFATVLEERFGQLAAELHVSPADVQGLCELQGLDPNEPTYWQRAQRLRTRLKEKFHVAQTAVLAILEQTPRASSIVENINSRLRPYFFLRRHLGTGYLDLLRFFLNHHRFLRSERPERRGKSPAELLTGHPHAHWLEMLGFQRFARN
jgi:hypothetical protein